MGSNPGYLLKSFLLYEKKVKVTKKNIPLKDLYLVRKEKILQNF